jgi:hypothetical protein
MKVVSGFAVLWLERRRPGRRLLTKLKSKRRRFGRAESARVLTDRWDKIRVHGSAGRGADIVTAVSEL